jgi:ketosteroid isomerase-like protein
VVHPNEELVRQAYEAQVRGDLDSYLELLTDDFVLHSLGSSRIAGEYPGR